MKLFFQVLAGGVFMWVFILTFYNFEPTPPPVIPQEKSNLLLDTPSTEPLPQPTSVIPEHSTLIPEPQSAPTTTQYVPPAPTETYAPPPIQTTQAYTPPPITWTPEPTYQTLEPPSRYYKNCKAVWNDISGPIYYGDPGFGSHLDADGDGVGCERKPNY